MNDFKRSKAIFAAIAAAMALGSVGERNAALGKIEQYKPRGKGRGTPSKRFGNPQGKYSPHQGKREMARRVRQMERLAVAEAPALKKAA